MRLVLLYVLVHSYERLTYKFTFIWWRTYPILITILPQYADQSDSLQTDQFDYDDPDFHRDKVACSMLAHKNYTTSLHDEKGLRMQLSAKGKTYVYSSGYVSSWTCRRSINYYLLLYKYAIRSDVAPRDNAASGAGTKIWWVEGGAPRAVGRKT